jgi:hypothetical protein
VPLTKPVPFQRAIADARARSLSLSAEETRAVQRSVETWADQLTGFIEREFGGVKDAARLKEARRLRAVADVSRETAGRMAVAVERSIERGRLTSFEDTLTIYNEASERVARAVGIPESVFGTLRPPPVTMLQAFEAAGTPDTWKSLIRGHIGNAAGEASAIIRMGFLEGVAPDELGRRLRRYIAGSEAFDDLFTDVPTLSGDVAKLNLRDVPADMREAARKIAYRAEMIGFSETSHARHEATVQHGLNDPIVLAEQWTRSPRHEGPDECDILAEENAFGLGDGIFPSDEVPALPHPWCLCELLPVVARSVAEMRAGKLQADRIVPMRELSAAGFEDMTPLARRRAQEHAERAMQMGSGGIRLAARRRSTDEAIAEMKRRQAADPAAQARIQKIKEQIAAAEAARARGEPVPGAPPVRRSGVPVGETIVTQAQMTAAVSAAIEAVRGDFQNLPIEIAKAAGVEQVVERVVLDRVMKPGEMAYYDPETRTVFVSREVSEDLRAASAEFARTGRIPDNFKLAEAIGTMIHETNHAVSPSLGDLKFEAETGWWMEEGLTERRARNAFAQAFDDVPEGEPWHAGERRFSMYGDYVGAFDFIGEQVGEDAVEEIWRARSFDDRAALWRTHFTEAFEGLERVLQGDQEKELYEQASAKLSRLKDDQAFFAVTAPAVAVTGADSLAGKDAGFSRESLLASIVEGKPISTGKKKVGR